MPEQVVTNSDLEKECDTTSEWIVERTGIRERRNASPNQATSDLALIASRRALEEAGVSPTEVELIVVGTVTGDMLFPSTACVLQHKLGAMNAAAMDVNAGCSGFIYALNAARGFIVSGFYRTVLVVGGEVLSRILDPQDRNTFVLFGDGAGAAVVEASSKKNRGVIAGLLGADGSYGMDLCMPGGGSRIPASVESVKARLHYMKMNGHKIFKVAVRGMANTVRRLMDEVGIENDDVKLIIPHQANLRIIEAMAKRLHFPMERVFVNIDKYGNTSAATCIIALDEACKTGLIKTGDITILVAFGTGLTWGGVVIRW